MQGFSIVVCCYNSAEVLPKTLRNLARLRVLEDMEVEIIIIDNGCTDNTVDTAKEVWKNEEKPFKLVIEKEDIPGLSAARERGISLAQYEYLVFCDDDNRLNEDYLIVADRLFAAHPEVGALGGYGEPEWEEMPDYWPDDFYIYGSGPQSEKSGRTHYVHGAGVIIRKKVFLVLKKVNFSFILSDRKKDRLTSGGDYELCYAIALAGYDIWYDQQLQFLHFIPSERMTWTYCKRFIEESTPALDVLDVYHFLIKNHEQKTGISRFYLKQLKVVLYHFKELMVSAFLKRRYRRKRNLYFLERFHQKFHFERVKCICLNVFNYSVLYRRIYSLKKRLAIVKGL